MSPINSTFVLAKNVTVTGENATLTIWPRDRYTYPVPRSGTQKRQHAAS